MSWILFASLAPLLWACTNIIDEYMVKNHFPANPYALLFIDYTVRSLPISIALLLYPAALQIDLISMVLLSGLGAFLLLSFLPYIRALQHGGASLAVPLFQTIPVFTFFLGWLFLGETVTTIKMLASGLIIASAVGIVWDFSAKVFNIKVIYLMLVSSVGVSIHAVLSKYFLYEIDWLSALIWMWVGSCGASVVVITFHAPWRKTLYGILFGGRLDIIGCFMLQALVGMGAMALVIKAFSLAPSAGLVTTMGGLQSFYVFVLAGFLGVVSPKIFKKIHMDKVFYWRIFCIAFLFVGVAILSLSE